MPEHPSSSPFSAKTTQDLDWKALREKSLQPGGFGAGRVELWPQILGVSNKENAVKDEDKDQGASWESLTPHRDERQIRLDTDRSLVLYPGGTIDSSTFQSNKSPRESHQTSLNRLLIRLFRCHPKLSYFQGFHDISTVIYLTIPDTETQYRCLEKMSLQRLRDSMGKGLKPVLGLVRITRNLLRLCSPDYARTVEQTSQLPFHSLTNLLTLFSHDMPTLELIQHVFDWMLAREPVACVYLVTAILLARRPELDKLRENDDQEDMGMAHSVLSKLPFIVDSLDPVNTYQSPTTHLPAPSRKPQPLSLTTLLRDADRLLKEYPPTHPSLRIREIMGPKSVVFTWTETFEDLPAEEEVEGWPSERLEEVVLPFVEEPKKPEEEELDEEKDEQDLISEKPRGLRRRYSSTNSLLRNRLWKHRRQWYPSHRIQTTVKTTLLVLCVALAVYWESVLHANDLVVYLCLSHPLGKTKGVMYTLFLLHVVLSLKISCTGVFRDHIVLYTISIF